MTLTPDPLNARDDARHNRRAFLQRIAQLTLTTAVGAALLEACAPAAPSTPTSTPAAAAKPTLAATSAPSAATAAATNPLPQTPAAATSATFQGVTLPSYFPFTGPKPDLAGNAQGLDPAYFQFPKDLVKSVTRTPGDGSDVSVLSLITQAAPPPMDQNAAWQQVNKEVGVTFR